MTDDDSTFAKKITRMCVAKRKCFQMSQIPAQNHPFCAMCIFFFAQSIIIISMHFYEL